MYRYFVDRAQDFPEGVRDIEELLYTNVGDGKLEWGSFLGKSEIAYYLDYLLDYTSKFHQCNNVLFSSGTSISGCLTVR